MLTIALPLPLSCKFKGVSFKIALRFPLLILNSASGFGISTISGLLSREGREERGDSNSGYASTETSINGIFLDKEYFIEGSSVSTGA